MRTTIELPDELRAKLLELAARRGEKGFSALVTEAVARYVADESRRADRVREAVSTLGSLDDAAAAALEASIRELRATWRSS
ncbi:MAG TPA: ribbon-helix-helix protein, CopG family [Gemmatimonadales bacterium]|nr:ribbon-helix-helix protein, CopG family [Gemmatimonadales bacterium]